MGSGRKRVNRRQIQKELGVPDAAPTTSSEAVYREGAGVPDAPAVCKDPEVDVSPGVSDSAAVDVGRQSGFDGLGLKAELLRGIREYPDCGPSTTQGELAIRTIMDGRDVVVQLPGAEKSFILAVSALQKLDKDVKGIQALILAPTRELAQYLEQVVGKLGEHMGARTHACFGGTKVRQEAEMLRETNVDVVVGTPGRVLDLINRRALRTENVGLLCVDEADELFARTFKDQADDIFQRLPKDKLQVAIFSDMDLPSKADVRKFTKEPVTLASDGYANRLDGIVQFRLSVQEEGKLEALCSLCHNAKFSQAIVFCNTKKKVNWVAEKMVSRGVSVSPMHGDVKQEQREVLMQDLRSGSSRVMITTDLQAYALDLPQVQLIVNYDMPPKIEAYAQRVPRSGVKVVNVVTPNDEKMFQDILERYGTQADEMPSNIADLI